MARDVEDLQEAALSVDKVVRDAAMVALKKLGVDVPERKSDSASIQQWLERSEAISSRIGKVAAGEKIYAARQCACATTVEKLLAPRCPVLQGVLVLRIYFGRQWTPVT